MGAAPGLARTAAVPITEIEVVRRVLGRIARAGWEPSAIEFENADSGPAGTVDEMVAVAEDAGECCFWFERRGVFASVWVSFHDKVGVRATDAVSDYAEGDFGALIDGEIADIQREEES